MPTVKRLMEYSKTLQKDTFVITKSCCTKLKTVTSSDWGFCPYCGEEIAYELSEVTVEQDEVKKS